MKRRVIEHADLVKVSPVFKNREWLCEFAMRLFGVDKINDLYERSCSYKGAEFASHILDDLGVECILGNSERLKQLPKGAFITISNHPYGGLDGVILIDLIAQMRPDYKVMVNHFLSLVEAMNTNFVPVIPKVGKKSPNPASLVNGIRETLEHLKEGHPMGFFPAGAVSMFFVPDFRIRDREWQEGVIKIIEKAGVPVLPVRFFDRNSRFFYFLGLLNWRVRSVRMSYELFNKSKRPQRIGIGELIEPEKFRSCKDIRTLTKLLRNSVYKMPVPKAWVTRKKFKNSLRLDSGELL
jgi:putative hemolysin